MSSFPGCLGLCADGTAASSNNQPSLPSRRGDMSRKRISILLAHIVNDEIREEETLHSNA
jgi:hypothetical protein